MTAGIRHLLRGSALPAERNDAVTTYLRARRTLAATLKGQQNISVPGQMLTGQ